MARVCGLDGVCGQEPDGVDGAVLQILFRTHEKKLQLR
jgi:hypothetical protein